MSEPKRRGDGGDQSRAGYNVSPNPRRWKHSACSVGGTDHRRSVDAPGTRPVEMRARVPENDPPAWRVRRRACGSSRDTVWQIACDARIDKKSTHVEISGRSGIQWGNGMTRWCLIVALVFAAPGCHRQVLSDEQRARSVGISPAPDPIISEQLPVAAGAELKDRPDDNPQPANSASPEEDSAPISYNARKEAVTSPPAPAPEASLKNEIPEPAPLAAPVARTTPWPASPLPLHRRGESLRWCETFRRPQLLAFRRRPRRIR